MGKRIVDEDMSLNINVNGNKGKKELYELEDRVKDLNSENEKLERSLQKYEKQIASNEKTINRYNRTLEKEAANQAKQEKIYTNANSRLTELYSTYKKMDSSAKESSFGKKIIREMQEVEDAVRKSATSGRNSMSAQEALRKSIGKLTIENEKLTKKRSEDTAVLDKNKAAVHEADTKIASMRKNLNITTLSIDELNKEITRTNILFRNTDPNDPKWKEYQKTLAKLRTQHQKLSSQAESTKGVLCRLADGVNKYWSFIASGLATITGVVAGIKGATNKYVEFTDVLADVRKTTGLTEQGVLELNDALKKIDTRTSQEELMGLARVGGKLGIEGKENLEGFVRAADKINVALKEDLGGDTEEAINQVGKLVDIFKVEEKYGIEQGMLKVGSVINELGAASTANEGYIVEFSKRVAGVAPSAGVSVSAVMGLAATLDQFGQQSEVSSTVYSKVMTGMFKKTGEYARVAGMDVASFSALLKTDANEAFVKVLEGLKGNNAGMEQLVANMGDLGLDGSRAVTVLGTLANNTETLREQQLLANDAFREGTSLTNEFNIKNTNIAAQAEKAKKILNQRIIDLGEKLQPALTLCTSGMSMMVKVLGTLADFFTKYGGAVLWTATAIGVYTVGLKAEIIWQKVSTALTGKAVSLHLAEAGSVKTLTAAKLLLVDGYKKAIVAVKAFGRAMMENPWGLVAVGIAAVVAGIIKLCTTTNEAKKAFTDFQVALEMERGEANRLFEAYKKTNAGTKERADIIQILQSKYGDYLKNMIDEEGNLIDIKKAQDEVNTSLERNVAIKMKQESEGEISKGYIKQQVDGLNYLRKELEKETSQESAADITQQVKVIYENNTDRKAAREEIDSLFTSHNLNFKRYIVDMERQIADPIYKMKDELGELNKMYDTVLGKGNKLVIPDVPEVDLSDIDVHGKHPVRKKEADPSEKEADPPVDAPEKSLKFENEMTVLKEQYAQQLVSKEEFEAKMDVLEVGHLQYRLANETKTEEEKLKLRQEIADKTVAIQEKLKKALETAQENQAYVDGDFIEDDTNDPALEKEWKAAVDVSKGLNQEAIANAAPLVEENKQKEKGKKSVRQKYGLAETEEEEAAKPDKLETLSQQKEAELELLNSYEEQGIISHEEAERLKTETSKKYNKERMKMAEKALNAANQLLGAGASVFSAMKDRELAAAGDNEAKKEEIRKKYAKKEKALAIGQAITAGALAIMQIWKSSATGNLLTDTPIKIAMTVAQAAMTAAQVATITAQQYEKGRYPVMGADDGQTYDAEYTDRLQTGVYDKPTLGLFSEKKPELVVDGSTTRKLVFDYPEIYNSILDVSRGRTPQFAQGRYPATAPEDKPESSEKKSTDPEMKKLLQATLETMAAVRDKEVSIPWYGSGGLSEMMKKSTKYEKRTNL